MKLQIRTSSRSKPGKGLTKPGKGLTDEEHAEIEKDHRVAHAGARAAFGDGMAARMAGDAETVLRTGYRWLTGEKSPLDRLLGGGEED